MGRVSILDCTLRDGGYINDWYFGKTAIDFILRKLVEARIEFIEVGFIKGDRYDEDRTVFPDCPSIRAVLPSGKRSAQFVGMVDMSAPVPLDRIPPRTEEDVELIRVIFKQNRLDEGLEYLKAIKEKGYLVMAQLVSTDTYTDEELIEAIKRLNKIKPYAVYLVDSLGVIKNTEFLRMIYLMDHNMSPGIVLGYHSHNNLQQAMGNAVSFININLKRDIIIDACVFGMGRGAGNLNEELFAEYLNENLSRDYQIDPMLEIIDEYLGEICKKNFWGYSLPFYLTAKNKVHPNYGKYYNAKGTLTEREFDKLLQTIAPEDTHTYSAARAEEYYLAYMKKPCDDTDSLSRLRNELSGKEVLLICPGDSLGANRDIINKFLEEHPSVRRISVAFQPSFTDVDYIFCSNMKRFNGIKNCAVPKIITSNVPNAATEGDYVLQYSSFIGNEKLTYDNAGLMALKVLLSIKPNKVYVAGMDGYLKMSQLDANRDVSDSEEFYVEKFNSQMSKEISEIRSKIDIEFITSSIYEGN